jgi:hypothetical protein
MQRVSLENPTSQQLMSSAGAASAIADMLRSVALSRSVVLRTSLIFCSTTVPSRCLEGSGDYDASASDWVRSDSEEDAQPAELRSGAEAAHGPAAAERSSAANQSHNAASPAAARPPKLLPSATTGPDSSVSVNVAAAAATAAAAAAAEAESAAVLAVSLSDAKSELSRVKLLLSRERLRASAADKARSEAEHELGLLRAEIAKLKCSSAAVPSRDSAEVAKAHKAKEQYRKEAESLRRQVRRLLLLCAPLCNRALIFCSSTLLIRKSF